MHILCTDINICIKRGLLCNSAECKYAEINMEQTEWKTTCCMNVNIHCSIQYTLYAAYSGHIRSIHILFTFNTLYYNRFTLLHTPLSEFWVSWISLHRSDPHILTLTHSPLCRLLQNATGFMKTWIEIICDQGSCVSHSHQH